MTDDRNVERLARLILEQANNGPGIATAEVMARWFAARGVRVVEPEAVERVREAALAWGRTPAWAPEWQPENNRAERWADFERALSALREGEK
jgi:hypothetical protein